MSFSNKNHWIIWTSVFITLILQNIFIEEGYVCLAPNLLFLIFIYWMVSIPNYGNLIVACCVIGLIMDVMIGGPLGIYSLIYTVIIYIISKKCSSFHKIVMLKQIMIIFVISLFMNISNYLLLLLIIHHNFTLVFLSRSIIDAILWPLLFFCMEKIRSTLILK